MGAQHRFIIANGNSVPDPHVRNEGGSIDRTISPALLCVVLVCPILLTLGALLFVLSTS